MKGQLCWRDMEVILLKCVIKEESKKIFNDMLGGFFGGHYMAKMIAHKLTRDGF